MIAEMFNRTGPPGLDAGCSEDEDGAFDVALRDQDETEMGRRRVTWIKVRKKEEHLGSNGGWLSRRRKPTKWLD